MIKLLEGLYQTQYSHFLLRCVTSHKYELNVVNLALPKHHHLAVLQLDVLAESGVEPHIAPLGDRGYEPL